MKCYQSSLVESLVLDEPDDLVRGPLDLVGLDTSVSILDALYAEFKDENFVPAKTLRTLLAEGKLGRKTKQGFFSY